MAVASTEYGNVPFNESMLASIILSHLPVAWKNQYNLTHTIVPESPRAILLDLCFTTCVYCYDKSKCQVSSNTIPGFVHDIDATGNAGMVYFRDQSHFNVIEFAQ
jgi:hypothetical protein